MRACIARTHARTYALPLVPPAPPPRRAHCLHYLTACRLEFRGRALSPKTIAGFCKPASFAKTFAEVVGAGEVFEVFDVFARFGRVFANAGEVF